MEQKFSEVCEAIAFVSHKMTPAEINYCQLEKETLSILFRCTKFGEYICGKKCQIENDSKPLKVFTELNLV